LDLEFVQLLGDPSYVEFLVAMGYTREKEFLNYLKYLEYLKTPECIIYIKYPEGLKYLGLLQQPEFGKLLEVGRYFPNETGNFNHNFKMQG
jgi:mediator of RNA polymerase II transcription subunit 31